MIYSINILETLALFFFINKKQYIDQKRTKRFLFLKTVFCSKNQEEQGKHGKRVWFLVLKYTKNIENTKFI